MNSTIKKMAKIIGKKLIVTFYDHKSVSKIKMLYDYDQIQGWMKVKWGGVSCI